MVSGQMLLFAQGLGKFSSKEQNHLAQVKP